LLNLRDCRHGVRRLSRGSKRRYLDDVPLYALQSPGSFLNSPFHDFPVIYGLASKIMCSLVAAAPDGVNFVVRAQQILIVQQAGTATVDSSAAISVFYNDLPRPQAEYWTSRLLPQSLGVYWSRTTHAAWRYIPTTYVLCGNDQSITLPYAEMILSAAQSSRPNMIDSVERCDTAGHSVMLSHTEWTANMLRRATGEQI